jgi:hypothetical protein
MAMIEFVDFNKVYQAGKLEDASKKTRRRRGSKAKSGAPESGAPATDSEE